MLRKDQYIKIYQIIYIATIHRMIDETRYIVILQSLNKNGFKTYHIDEFEKLILYMRSIGMNDGFAISLTIHLRDLAYRKLLDTARLSDDIGLILGCKKIQMVYRVDSIKKYLEHSKTLVRSFAKIEPSQPSQSFQPFQQFQPNTAWHYQMRRDIIRRLYLLSHKHFTLVQLQHMGVGLRLASELNRIAYPMLVSYYLDTVRKIYVAIDALVDVCELYREIDTSYAISCGRLIQGLPAVILLQRFQICYPIVPPIQPHTSQKIDI